MTGLLLYCDNSSIYGAEQCAHLLALELQERGWRVAVAQPRAEHRLVDERRARSIPHHWLPPNEIYVAGARSPCLIDRATPTQLFRSLRPERIHFHDSSPFSNLAAKRAAAELGIPHLVTVHLVVDHWADEFRDHATALRSAYAAADEVVAVSRENLERLRRRFGLPSERGRVVHNARPEAFFEPRDEIERQRRRDELGVPADALAVLSVGRVELAKGYQFLLGAVEILRRSGRARNLRFLWAGDGTLLPKLRALAGRTGAGELISFLGERSDVPALLDAADLFVLASEFEGMPLVVLEAMAKGLPVIATAAGGTAEALGDTGRLLPPPGPGVPLARLLATEIEALARDHSFRERLGKEARGRAEQAFRADRMVTEYEELLGAMTGTVA